MKPHRPSGLAGLGAEPLADALARLGVPEGGWDWLLAGDGSSNAADCGCGWACVAVDRLGPAGENRRVFTGAADYGGVQFAEAMAFASPLQFVAAVEAGRRARWRADRACRVHLLTDSEDCHRRATRPETRHPAEAVFRAFDALGALGFDLRWHLVARETVGLHALADRASRAARIFYEQGAPAGPVLRGRTGEVTGSVYDVNP